MQQCFFVSRVNKFVRSIFSEFRGLRFSSVQSEVDDVYTFTVAIV